MTEDSLLARKLLEEEGCTCVLCKQDTVYKSFRRGISPLLTVLEKRQDFSGFSAADKVVGKAAALLYCLMQVRAVYAPVISRSAQELLQAHNISVHYGLCVCAIKNRTGDGLCPMETAVQHITDPRQALPAIRKALSALQQPPLQSNFL